MVQVNGAIKKERVKRLEEIDAQLHDEYLLQLKGKEQTVLVETIQDNFAEGYTENYIKVYLNNSKNEYHIGDLVKIKVGEKFKDGVMPQDKGE